MEKWEEFEIQCTNYLNDKFGYYADFFHQGGADSTVPDILVKTKKGKTFYIDAKLSPAQCGQFVLLPDLETHTFEYSPKNANRINRYAKMIINHMNQDFDTFREAGTTGKEISMPNGYDIFAGWIVQTYQDKGVEFFITNDFTILPIEKFNNYFQVTAKYRIKRSGSGNVGKSKIDDVTDYIVVHDYDISEIHTEGNKLFATSRRDLNNQRFILCGIEYMFALREDIYELRKLSNTHNANVIFSIKQKSLQGMSDEDFIKFLK